MSQNPLSQNPLPAGDTLPAEDVAAECRACPHPLADHDAVALRFCAAMAAGGSTRRCLCSASTGGMTYSNSTRGPISGGDERPRN
jgi:hypothetical protein